MHELLKFEKHNPKYRFDCFETVQADCIEDSNGRKLMSQSVDQTFCHPRSTMLSSSSGTIWFWFAEKISSLLKMMLKWISENPNFKNNAFIRFSPLTQKQFQVCGLDEKMYHIECIAHRHMMLLSTVNEKGGCALLPEKVAVIRLFSNLTYYHLKNAFPTVISLVRLWGKTCTDPLFQYFIDKKKQGRI